MPTDMSKYPPDWKETRKRILERANNRCERCGVQNYALREKGGGYVAASYFASYAEAKKEKKELEAHFGALSIVVLTIAHFDHDAENHDVKDD